MPGEGFKIADGYVEVSARTDAVDKDVAGISGRVAPTAVKAGFGIAKTIVTGFIAYGVGRLIGNQIKAGFSEASDLNETISKSTAIFGDGVGAMLDWGRTAPWALGLSSSAALASAASFGDMFTQLGFASSAAAEMSRQTVQAAADLGSFNNLPTADVADRVAAAFRGEYDSLQAVIPNINAARVESEALAATGKKVASELTAQEKAAAVLAIVQKDGARAMGDFEKTSDGWANSLKIGSGIVSNLQASIGQGLLPVGESMLGLFNSKLGPAMLAWADTAVPAMTAGVQSGIDFFVNWRGTLADFVGWLDGTDIGGEVTKSFPSLLDLGERASTLFSEKIWPAVQNVSTALVTAANQTGISTWGIFVSILQIALPVIEFLATAALQLSQFLRDNQAVVNGLLIAYTAYRAILIGVTAYHAITTGAVLGTAAAWALQKIQLVASTGAWIAARAAMIGGAVATGVMTAAQWAFNVAASANPIGLIIIAIAALIAIIIALVMNWDTVVKFLTDVWNNFVSWFTGVMDAFGAWWNDLWSGFGSFVTDVWNGFIGWIVGIWDNFLLGLRLAGALLSAWWNDLWSGIGNWVKSVWDGFIKWILDIFRNFLVFMKGIGDGLVSWWNGLWTGLGDFVKGAFDGVVGFVKSMINNVIRLVNGAIGGINEMGNLARDITGGAIGWTIAPLPMLAKGSNFAPDAFIAGERGPELITGARGATVRPYSATKDLLAGKGDSGRETTEMHFHEGAFSIDLSKIKSLEDLIELLETLAKTARAGRGPKGFAT